MTTRKLRARPETPAWVLRGRAKSALIYFADPATKSALDTMAKAAGLTRSQMIARLVEQEAVRRARRSN